MTQGYPAQRTTAAGHAPYRMFFGGLPYNTYTTVSLHSSIDLLSKMNLMMKQIKDPLSSNNPKFIGFSTELHTPISIYNGKRIFLEASGLHDFSQYADTYPAFLFSFKGEYSAAVATARVVNTSLKTP